MSQTAYKDTDLTIVCEDAEKHKGLLDVSVLPDVSEYVLRIAKWRKKSCSKAKGTSYFLLNIIEEYDKDMYLSINILLYLRGTLHTSTESSERSFLT